jgi:anti-anti-sigma factor
MDILVSQHEEIFIVALTGKLDALTAPTYEKTLAELITDGATRVVLDFDALSYISSAGLRSLLITAKSLKSKGGKLLLANVQGGVRAVFEMSGFGTIFAMHDSVATALADS